MIRMDLPAGDYDLDLEIRNSAGAVIGGETLHQIQVTEGGWVFFNRRVY